MKNKEIIKEFGKQDFTIGMSLKKCFEIKTWLTNALAKQKKEILNQIREIIKNFAFKFPITFDENTEWYKGYKYCKDGVSEELDDILKQLDKLNKLDKIK